VELEEIRQKMSLLSAFLDRKIEEKEMTIRELSEITGISRRWLYLLISEKRTKPPSSDTLNKIADALEFSEKDREFVLALADKERETGEIVYSEGETSESPSTGTEPTESGPVEPVQPSEPEEPEIEPAEPVEPEPTEPTQPPSSGGSVEPQPVQPPGPPEPEPGPPVVNPNPPEVSSPWKNKSVIFAMVVIFVGGLIVGCCGSSVFIPLILDSMGMGGYEGGW